MIGKILKFFGRETEQDDSRQSARAAESLRSSFELVERPQEDGNGGGFVVRRCSDGQLLSWTTLPKKQGIESINVVGEAYRLDHVQNPAFRPGSSVLLIPEPTNPIDSNALAVWSSDRAFQAGYIPKEDAVRIRRKLDRWPHDVFVLWETRDGHRRVNIRLLLVRDDVDLLVRKGCFVRSQQGKPGRA